MATTLTGATVSSTYDALIKIGDNGPVTGTLKVLSDGLGNDLPVQISTSTMKITGTLDVTTGILTVATPTANTHATTKIYVDTLVGNEETARITADSNLQSQITANALDISNLENGVGTVSSINTLDGDITLTSGSGASVSVAGQTITISATGTGVQSIAVTAPLTSTGGTTPTIGIPIVTQSDAGAMSATDKQKLDGIAAGAEVNVQANWTETNTSSDAFIQNKPTIVSAVNGTAPITVSGTTTRTVAISAATTSAAGSMSSADKTKLDGIETGAQVNDVDSVNGQVGIVVLDADDIDDATTTHKFTTASDITKLAGIQAGAEVNQNAYSNFQVGATTISAGTKTDTLTLVAGSNITLTPNASTDTITIDASGGGGGGSDSFNTIASTGLTSIVAASGNDTLNIEKANGIVLTTDNTTKTLTISQNVVDTTMLGLGFVYWDGTKLTEDGNVFIDPQNSEIGFDYLAYFNQGFNASGDCNVGDTMTTRAIVVDKAYISGAGSYGVGSRVIKNTFTGTSLTLGRIYSVGASAALSEANYINTTAEGMLVVAINTSAINGVLKEGMVRVSGTPFTGATVGQKVYLASNGAVSTTAPTTGTLRILGYVVDTATHMMYFNPDTSYITL